MVKSLVLAIMISFYFSVAPHSCMAEEERDYAIIYAEISAYNGNYQEANWLTNAILYASNLYGVDPLLVTAMMEEESSFNLNSLSSAGAIGPMQLMPDTAKMIGVDPHDPLENIIGGVSYLRNQLDTFNSWGTYGVSYAVAAYNAGSHSIFKYNGVPPYNETINYVRAIAQTYNRLLAM